MTTRHIPASHSSGPSSHSPGPDNSALPWLSIGIAFSAVCLCGGVFASVSAEPGTGWLASATGASVSQAFGAAPALPNAPSQPTKLLAGISGQTFSTGARQNASADAELPKIAANIAPVAWDRLPAGDCITVTTKSGQNFSFQILGARPVGKPEQADNPAKIELAVSGCTDMGEPIAKAVIQPTNPAAPKAENAARTL